RVSMSRAKVRLVCTSTPRNSSGNSTFSNAVFQGSKLDSWNTTPISSGSGFVIGRWPTRIQPELGSSKPAIIINKDDLPQPLGPTSPINLPLSILNDTSSSACTGPLLD